ncbi:MAG: pilin [bacterium]|nr:pilin [bacterium]
MGISLSKITTAFFGLLIVGILLALLGGTLPVSAQDIQNNLCAGANLDVNSNCNTGITNQDASAKINSLIGSIINIFTLVVGVVSVLMIIVGGFKYITSGGDSTNVSGAKNTILYAIIGLVIVALAQTIVRFILGRVISA